MEFLVVMHLLMIVFMLQSFLSQCYLSNSFLASAKCGLVFLAVCPCSSDSSVYLHV